MKRNDTKGYTLIELIIVLAILSAMLLMASLRADLGTAALRSEAQSVRQRFFIFIIISLFCKVQDKTNGVKKRPDT